MTAHNTTRRSLGTLAVLLGLAAMLAALVNTGRSHAQIAVGDIVIFETCQVVSLEVLDSDAEFTSFFWRFGNGPDLDLGVDSKQVGEVINLGQVPANTEVILGIVVKETTNIFKTGPGDRNPDGQVHAMLTGDVIGFEDKAKDEANADWDYNDAELRVTTTPCPPRQVSLTVQIDPASTGSGGVGGTGTYDLGVLAHATASPAAGSTFGGWSGDCNGTTTPFGVVMDSNKTCVALFLAEVAPTPTPTPVDPIAGPPPTIGINNTRTSPSPANVGDTVIFRIDTTLLEVPLANEAEVLITFDDTHLAYVGSLTSECALFPIGIVCDFGPATAGFSFDLDFEALAVTASTSTHATLGADYDGPGAGAPATAGPASADVAIVDVEGIQLPPLGDGSVGGGSASLPMAAVLLGIVAAGSVVGTGAGVARRRRAQR